MEHKGSRLISGQEWEAIGERNSKDESDEGAAEESALIEREREQIDGWVSEDEGWVPE